MPGQTTKRFLLGANVVMVLDLVRAVAANLVVMGHAADVFAIPHGISPGGLGLSLFFVLSGFLITGSSLSRLAGPGPRFTPYLIDRAARIFTAYVPALIFVALADIAFALPPQGQPGMSHGPAAFLGNLLLLQDYPLFQLLHRLAGDAFYLRPYNTAEQFWTIPVEFCIYLIFGLLVFGLFGRERLRPGAALAITIVALPVVVWNAAAGGANGLSLVWLLGAAAAMLWAGSWRSHPNRGPIGLLICATAAICLLGRGLKFGWDFQDLNICLCETLLFLGLVAAVDGARRFPPVLARLAGFLASYSYSLYLVHNIVLIAVRQTLSATLGAATLPVAILAAHAVALGFYWAFERHYRRVAQALKRRERRKEAVLF
jgi:peptidoglycan/LPS O-acetylase OafA/YrhL